MSGVIRHLGSQAKKWHKLEMKYGLIVPHFGLSLNPFLASEDSDFTLLVLTHVIEVAVVERIIKDTGFYRAPLVHLGLISRDIGGLD